MEQKQNESYMKKLIDETPNKGNKHAIGYVIAENAEDKPEQVRKINMKIAEAAIIMERREMEENINLIQDLQHRYNYILRLRKEWKSLSPYPEFVDDTDVWLDGQLKTLAEILATKDKGATDTKKPSTYTSLKEIFVSEDAYNEAIRALQEVNTPVIDKNLNYLLGERQKSAITAWFEVLETKGKIKTISAPEKARLLNDTIRGLNISEKTTQIPENKIERASSHKKYFPRFNFLISQN